jgi:hypothetical protein
MSERSTRLGFSFVGNGSWVRNPPWAQLNHTCIFYGKTYEQRYAFYYSGNWGMKLAVFSTRPRGPRVGPNEIEADVANPDNNIL